MALARTFPLRLLRSDTRYLDHERAITSPTVPTRFTFGRDDVVLDHVRTEAYVAIYDEKSDIPLGGSFSMGIRDGFNCTTLLVFLFFFFSLTFVTTRRRIGFSHSQSIKIKSSLWKINVHDAMRWEESEHILRQRTCSLTVRSPARWTPPVASENATCGLSHPCTPRRLFAICN